MEQLSLAGMPRRLYRCTPTRLTAWLDCPRRYRMSYLDRPVPPKGPPWAHNSLGASVHNALAGWWRRPLAGRTVPAAGNLLEAGWIDEGFADQAQSTAARGRARRMVERYVAGLDPAREPVGVERTVATRTDRIAVSGRIDRLDERPGDGGPEDGGQKYRGESVTVHDGGGVYNLCHKYAPALINSRFTPALASRQHVLVNPTPRAQSRRSGAAWRFLR